MATTPTLMSYSDLRQSRESLGQSKRWDGYSTPSQPQILPPVQLEMEVVRWSEQALRQAREEAEASPQNKLSARIIEYLNGNQWPKRPTAYGSSRPVQNRMFRQYWEVVSLLTDGKMEPEINIWDKVDTYSQIQNQLGLLLQKWAETASTGYRNSFEDVVGFGMLSRGVGKIEWNRNLNGGMGDVYMTSVDPRMLFKLGGDGTVDNSECVIETQLVTMQALYRKYGTLAKSVEPDPIGGLTEPTIMRPGRLSSAEWAKYSPQMQRVLGVKTGGGMDNLYPMVLLRHYWLKDPSVNESSKTIRVGPEFANWSYLVEPGQELFPRGRLISVAGRKVMNDTCNPYFHGKAPFVEFTPLRVPWASDGMSLMGNLISPQDILNRILAGLLETIKAGLLPTIITPRNAVSRSDLDNMSTTISGGRLEYNPLAPSPPKFRDQPQVSPLALPFVQLTAQEMDQTTGSAAINAAAQKDQVPSHDSLELINNSRSAMIRLMGRRLEAFGEDAGNLVVSDMLQFYSVGHRVAILGQRGIMSSDFVPLYGSMLQKGVLPEQFVRKFQMTIKPGSALSFGKETRAQMALVLRRQGDLSQKNMFRALDAGIDVAQNQEELIEEAKIKMALAGIAQSNDAITKAAAKQAAGAGG